MKTKRLCRKLSTAANTCSPRARDGRSTGRLSSRPAWVLVLGNKMDNVLIPRWDAHRHASARAHTHSVDSLRLIKYAAVHVKNIYWLGHAVKARDLQIQVVALLWEVSRKIYKKQRSKLERKDLGGVVLYFPFSFCCLSWGSIKCKSGSLFMNSILTVLLQQCGYSF